MKQIAICLILLFAASNAIVTQDLSQRAASEAKTPDDADLINSLRQLKSTDEREFIAGDKDYLLARTAESNGQLALAVTNYQSVADRGSILKPYALRHLAKIARSTGNLVLERFYLRQLSRHAHDSGVTRGVPLRMAENAFEAGNYAAAIAIINGGMRTGTAKGRPAKNVSVRDVKALLAAAYDHSGQTAKARELYDSLIGNDPDPDQPDDVSVKAALGLDRLDGGITNFGKAVPVLSETEHLKRAGIYQFNRLFDDARHHYLAIINHHRSGTSVPEAALQIGRGYVQQLNFVEAVLWFERIREQYPQSGIVKDALLQAASAYGRIGKPREAVSRYQQYIDNYPGDARLDRAYLNIVDVLRDHGEEVEALRWCAKTRDAFKGQSPEALAVFSEARLYIAKENWPDALNALEQMKGLPDTRTLPGGTTPAETAFLRAFVLEQLKRYPEAIDAYLSIPDGKGEYYGWRSTIRLQALRDNDGSRSFIDQKLGSVSAAMSTADADGKRKHAHAMLRLTALPEVREKALDVLKSSPRPLTRFQEVPNLIRPRDGRSLSRQEDRKAAAAIAERLLDLELYDEAAPLAESLIIPATGLNDLYTVATYYKRGDRGDLAVAFMEPVLRGLPADHPIELIPREQLELLYPAPFSELLVRYATEQGVDPRLLLAIMRQESNFEPDARSNAAARGLMQFTAPTAARIARSLGRASFEQDDLYEPGTSVLFGARYVADLFRDFPSQAEAVVASYNGGEDNMRRWLSRSRSGLPERYVPEIAYSQTKDYVFRVMANYRMYQFLYDRQLRPV